MRIKDLMIGLSFTRRIREAVGGLGVAETADADEEDDEEDGHRHEALHHVGGKVGGVAGDVGGRHHAALGVLEGHLEKVQEIHGRRALRGERRHHVRRVLANCRHERANQLVR